MAIFRSRAAPFGFVWSLVLVISCASYTDETREVVSSYRGGQYATALQKLDSSDVKEQSRNRLLYLLERSRILDRMGQGDESRKMLLRADQVVDQLYTTSISKTAASFVYNDAASDYAGEDYEKVAIHTMLAHSFIAEGNLAAARVEAARINTRLGEINSFYDENKNKYKEDAYARYLSGIIYEALGEDDNAIVDYRSAMKVYEGDYRRYFDTEAPDHLVEALARLLIKRNRADEARILREKYRLSDLEKDGKDRSKDTKGEVVVLHEQGLIARKERTEFVLPIANQVIRFSFPVIKPRRPSFGRTGVSAEGIGQTTAELSQNMDIIASHTLEDRRLRLVAKSAARLLLKGQMTRKAQEEFGILGWLAGNIYGAVTETADTRSWTLLPAAFSVSRLRLAPGDYELRIFNDGRTSDVRRVAVKAGEIIIIRDSGNG